MIWNEEAGPDDAPLVVVVHGSMDRSAGMLKLSRRLDDRYRVLRYDRRGYGRSVPCDGPFTMTAQVDDLIALLDERRAVLFGHSYGGNVTMAAAARRPDLVAAVAMYETPLSWEPWWPGSTAGAQAVATSGQPEEAAERFMRRMIGEERWESLPKGTRATRRREGIAMVGELSDLRLEQPWHAADITCPVVLGHGTLGAAHHTMGMKHVHGQFPDSTLIELSGCHHDAPLREAAQFHDELMVPLLRAAGGEWAAVASPSGS